MFNKHLSRILILLLIVQVAIGVFAFPVNQAKAAGSTYYVDNVAGSDSYDGLEQTHTTGNTGPFATIAHINSMGCGSGVGQLNPGDSVLFDSGETWREQLTVPCSGSAGSPITFGSYGSGAMPVISGANSVTGWTQGSVPAAQEPCTGSCIFDSGFENGGSSFSDWTSVNTYNETVTQSTAQVAHGNYSMAVTATASGSTQGYVSKTITPPVAGTPVYFRFYIYVPSGSLPDNLSSVPIFGSAGNSISLSISTNSSGNVSALQYYANGCISSCPASVSFAMNTWHYIDIEYLVGTTASNGGGEVWLDGTPLGSKFTLNTTAILPSSIYLGFAYGQNLANGGTAYFDDFRISPSGPIGAFTATTATNVWYSTVTTQPNIVAVNGIVSQAQSGYGSLTAGQWYWASNTLYVGSVASPTDVQAGTRDYSLTFPYTSNISYVTVDGITFQYANLDNVYIANGDQDTIQNCTITGAYQYGIWAFGYASPPGTLTYFTADGNTVSYNGASGIMINSKHTHVTVTRNIVHHNAYNTSNTAPYLQYMAGIYFFDNQSTPNYDLAAYNTVYSNGVFGGNGNQGLGIWMDTVYNSTMEYNNVHDNASTGIFLEASVNSAMIYNLSYGNATNQYSAGMASYATTFSASGNLIANNTVWGSHWWGLELGVYTGASVTWSNNTIENT
jgi:hypothetical protein